MSKVTYYEFRPGHWVKLVDGKIVGRATAEEVAAWKRASAEQAAIWQDVVQRAVPAESEPETPPETPLPKPKATWTESTKIWQDVLSQVGAAESKAEQSPQEAAKVKEKPKPLPETPPVEPIAMPKAVPPKPEEIAKPKGTVKMAPAKRAAKVEAIPAVQPAPAQAVSVEPAAKPGPTVKGKATPAKQAAKPAPKPATKAKPKVTIEVPAVKGMEAAKPASSPPQKAKVSRTAKAAKPVAEALSTEEKVSTRIAPAEIVTKSKRASSTTTRRSAAQPTPTERPSQLYLWIMAGLSDDLIATVRSGLARYQERFHQPAEVVLCHMDDVATLEKANLPVDVRQGKGVPPRSFWIGLK
ncbi:MAG: hypothetical protein ACUVR2_03475 [Anaerolineae bacterium]